jgi:hypothetical protein
MVTAIDEYVILDPGGDWTLAGQSGENLCAAIVEVLLYALGAANRRSPVGGRAYGMPRYSETPGIHVEEWPTTVPLVVLTDCPVFHGPAAAAVPTSSNVVEASAIMACSASECIATRP